MLDRLEDPQRNTDAVGEQGGDETIVDRHRKAVGDDTNDRVVVPERVPEIEANRVKQPGPVRDKEGPIEAVVLAESGQLLFRNVQLDAGIPASPEHFAPAPRARQTHTELVNLTSRDELAEQKGKEGDP